jgi:hypothetical protein
VSLPAWSLPAALGVFGVALIAWNLTLGSRITSLPNAGRAFRALSGLSAFLLLPALIIGVVAPSAPGTRVLAPIAWLWPAVTTAIAVQAWWCVLQRRTTLLVTLAIALLDTLVAWIAMARFVEGVGGALPAWALAPGVAVSALATIAFGDGAYLWGSWLLLPALAPAAPARWRLSGAWRAVVALYAVLALVLAGLEGGHAFELLRQERALGTASGAERARTEFSIGLRLFGTVSAPPSPPVARHDLALLDSLGAGAVHVTIAAEGITNATLDSIGRTLDARGDSVVLLVSIDGAPDARRGALVERVAQRLHPDVIVPAAPAAVRLRELDVIERFYTEMARTARKVDRNVTIALATAAASAADSALCDWVLQGGTPVDAVALMIAPASDNVVRYESALASMTRWATLARTPPPVWLLQLPSAPGVEGEVAQQHMLRHALQWSAAHSWVRGVIAADASDTWAESGVRTAGGRARRALAEVGAALRGLRDAPPPPPAPVDTIPVDTTRTSNAPSTPSRP